MAPQLSLLNLDDDLVLRLEQRAARHARSAEAELREILDQALGNEPTSDFAQQAQRLRERTAGRLHTPAEILIQEGRNQR